MQYGPEYGAAGALLGVAASELAALVLVMGFYRRKKREIYAQMKIAPKIPQGVSFRSTCKQIAKIAVPVTLGACIMPLVSAIDSAIVIRCLTNINYTVDEATKMFGMLTGYVNPLINMPAAISLALAMSLVPAISEARAARSLKMVQERSAIGFRLALLIGLPCALGFAFLADPILRLLYPTMSADTLTTTTSLLAVMSFGVLFLTMLQTMTGVLQGLGKVTVPVINLAIGAVVKLVVSLTLTQQPQINIMGAAIGTLSCYAVAAVLDIIMVVKYSKIRFKLLDYVVKPIICGGIMTVIVLYVYKALYLKSNTVACLVSIAAGAVIYIALLFILRALRPEDMETIPGGGKITKIMRKLHIWR